MHPRIRISKRFCPFLYFAAAVVTFSFIVFTSRLTLHPGILRNRATITRPSFSSVRKGKIFGEISEKFISPRLLREKYPRRVSDRDNDDGKTNFDEYIYIYMHTRSSRMDSSYVRLENGKGTLMRCEELKACVQRTDGTRREGGRILRLKGCSREEGEGYYGGSSADNYDEPPLDGRRMRIK